jgi:outer membrane protein OmpA-like peptidoglycan-associated protein
MTKQLAVVMIAALIAAPAWTAERSSAPKEEKIGVGGGAAIGALAGGPIGVVLGAALGGWAGDRFHQERSQRRDFEQRYERASADARSLENMLRGNERELATLRAVLADEQRSFRAALEEALEVHVYFRTAQSALDPDTEQRLAQVAGLLGEIGDFSIIVEGHADSRGDAAYNEQLSGQRAAAVRDVLIGAGLSPERITMRAAGESQATAAEGDLDALALERRVNLTIIRPDADRRVARQ